MICYYKQHLFQKYCSVNTANKGKPLPCHLFFFLTQTSVLGHACFQIASSKASWLRDFFVCLLARLRFCLPTCSTSFGLLFVQRSSYQLHLSTDPSSCHPAVRNLCTPIVFASSPDIELTISLLQHNKLARTLTLGFPQRSERLVDSSGINQAYLASHPSLPVLTEPALT